MQTVFILMSWFGAAVFFIASFYALKIGSRPEARHGGIALAGGAFGVLIALAPLCFSEKPLSLNAIPLLFLPAMIAP